MRPSGLLRILEVRARTAARDERFPCRPSRLSALLSCDAGAEFDDLLEVLSVLRHPAVRVTHLFFAARHEAGGEGAFAWFLPQDDCGCGHEDEPPRLVATAVATLGAGGADPAALFPALRALPTERLEGVLVLADPLTRAGDVLRAADLCLRAGARTITLGRMREADRGAEGLRLDGKPVPPLAAGAPRPPVPPRVEGPAGFARDVRVMAEDPIVDEAGGEDGDAPAEEPLGK